MAAYLRAIGTFGSMLLTGAVVFAQGSPASQTTGANAVRSLPVRTSDSPANVLAPGQWQRVDAAVGRALTWLANHQQSDGSFPTLDSGQPAVSSLCMMALIAHGHVP